jgi:tRNA-specific 2-thiouridylase
VLVAMSGGVDSSVAAALMVEQGHEVCGATLKLWGGPQDSGCCSVADVDDARRVAQQIGIDHYVFDMTEAFGSEVVEPYVAEHAAARTPNPCIECNRRIKFDRLLARAQRLGFDALATGHHARVAAGPGDRRQLRRGADRDKDQSYVVSMLDQHQLQRVCFPVGEMTKAEVRRRAAELGLRTADKPDSQDVCFISSDQGRAGFLGRRLALHPAEVRDASGALVGWVPALELVTVGQRRGFGHGPDGSRRYVAAVDARARRVVIGSARDIALDRVELVAETLSWTEAALADGATALAQTSAHGRTVPCRFGDEQGRPVVHFEHPVHPVAPGQTVALYDAADPDRVRGSGVVR